MRSGRPFFLYLVALCTLGLMVHVWWRSGHSAGTNIADELRPLRQELREVRGEIEEINRVSLKQQATLYKIEAMLDMQGAGVQPGATAITPPAPAPMPRTAEPGEVPPPPPPIDDRALSAFVHTQVAARHEATAGVNVQAASPAAPAAAAPSASAPSEQRQTVVFTKSSTGTIVRTGSAVPGAVRPQPVLPPAADGLTLEDLAALVSTVSVQAASMAAGPRPAEARGSVAAPVAAVRNTVDAADPALPGATPVAADMTRIAVEEPAAVATPAAPAEPARAAAPAPAQPQSTPRRVTTVPSLTAEPQPSVPPVRASRLARDERARAADITSALSLSDRLVVPPGQRTKITISDVLEAQENQ